MNRTTAVFLLPAVLAACATGGGRSRGVAPRSGTLSMNSEATATLRRDDARLSDNSVYHVWRFYGSAGQTIQIDVMSAAFDAYAILEDDNGARLATDDDGGDGLDARIVYTLPRSGNYRIFANTYRANRYGQYSIRLTSLSSGVLGGGVGTGPGMMGTLGRGQTVSGRLTMSDPRLNGGSVYHAYTYMGVAGETVVIEVISSDFDAYAIIQDGDGNNLAQDDDSGDGLNARLVFTLPYTGTYRIIANTYRQGAYGSYTLMVR
jgi:hypothetical protein